MEVQELQPKKIRAFIAVYPEPHVVKALEDMVGQLRADFNEEDIRWARPEQLHLTLQFLGHVEPDRLVAFQRVIGEVVIAHPGFHLSAETLGCFPGEKRPRIVWAGLTGETDPLQILKVQLDGALARYGYEPEKRAFHPHITLARIGELKRRDLVRMQLMVAQHKAVHFGAWPVRKIELMQSFLSPKGARYVPLQAFPLKQN